MNKRRSKALKGLADMLPDAYYSRMHTESGTLSELHAYRDKEGLDFDLPELTELNWHRVKSIRYESMELINHHKRLKKAWKEKKTEGIQEYIIWLNNHNIRFAKKMQMDVKSVEEGLLKIAKMKVSSFWKSLIAFLVSFVFAFNQEEENDSVDN